MTMKDELEQQIKELLEQGIIKRSKSPYNSPIWIVPKKNRRFKREKIQNGSRLSKA